MNRDDVNKELIMDKLEEHDKRLDKHGDAIDDLQTKTAVSSEKIDNLCKQLESLCNKIQWQNGFILTGIVALVVYIIQNAIKS